MSSKVWQVAYLIKGIDETNTLVVLLGHLMVMEAG
jgi:hypothetical protein